MHITRIPKGNGKFRTIYIPSPDEKYRLRRILHFINTRALAADTHKVAHGFMPGRSIITNALAHVGDWKITLHFDFEDFFDSVKPTGELRDILARAVGAEMLAQLFPDGAARQGLPTSPAIANIAAAPFDAAVIALRDRLTPTRRILDQRGPAFVYTRYADDLSFSTSSEVVADTLLREIPTLAAAHGFKINPAKTTRQHACAGSRIVTGIAVTTTGIRPTRHSRRRLRAATHQLQYGLRRRHLRRLLTKLTESYAKDSPRRIGDLLRGHWRGLAAFIRLIPPRQQTLTTSTPSTHSRTTHPHRAAPAIPMPFGLFNRRITT